MKKTTPVLLLLLMSALLSFGQTDFASGLRYIKVGNTLREAQQTDAAEEYLNKGLNIVKTNGTAPDEKYWEAVAYEYLGLLSRDKEEDNESIAYFNRALDLFKANGYSLSAQALEMLLNTIRPVAETYGGIDIGATGVKLSVINMTVNKKGELQYQIIKVQTINPEASSGTENAFNETAKAVTDLVDTLKNRGIPEDKIFIVVSSGLYVTLNKMSPVKVDELMKVLKNGVRNYAKDIPYLTAEKEGELTASGVLPRPYQHNSSAIDIGSGNTKGGYFASDDSFVPLTISFGTKSMTTAVINSNTANKSFSDAASLYYDSILKPVIQPELGRKPGLKNRRNVFMMGGIVWAMITYLHPDKIDDPYVQFTMADVKKFRNMAVNNYEQLVNPSLDALDNTPDLKKRAQVDISSVRDKTFNQENIIAGAILFEGILNEIDKDSPKKIYIFPRYGLVGWITRYVTKSVSDKLKGKKE